MSQPITLRRIYQARGTIAPYAVRTPLVRSDALSDMSGRDIFLKLETAQVTGAFKIRGAANRLCNLTPADHARGVVTVSTGNHGRAVPQGGRALGIRVVVCVPELVLPHKVAAMAKLGAGIVVAGANQDDAEAHAADLAAREGLTMVSPFDDPDVIAGQGTIGLEILEDLPAVGTVVAPLSGAGLLGGIALAVKTADPGIRVVGVSMAKGPVMVESVKAGRVVQLPEEPTLADSLMGGIGLDNRHSFELIRRLVDEYVLLSEDEIAAAMRHALLVEGQVVEGGGAVGLGALLHDKVATLGGTVAVVLSGRNVDMAKLLGIVSGSI